MHRRALVGAVAAGVLAVLVAGCGGSTASALKNPGSAGVEALRAQLRGAISDRDGRAQCELFAPMLLDEHGGSVSACARSLRHGGLPYMRTRRAYVAGGQVELAGNEAYYLIPFGQAPSEDPREFESETPQVAFAAVYTGGAWRLVARPPVE